MCNKMFDSLKKRGYTEKQLKYFSYESIKATNFGKFYFILKIHKRFHNVPGRSVISNCGTPTKKCSEFLDYHLKALMQRGRSYIKDFIKKTRNLSSISENSILVTADVVGLYPTIPHEAGLKALREVLNKRE